MRRPAEAFLRRTRKGIYALQTSRSPVARAAFHVVLAGYRAVDTLVLRRASRIDLGSEKIVSDERRFLCVVVPKSGSRTLVYGLQQAAAQGRFDLHVSERSIDAFTAGYEDYFTFAFVRDPWARAYSCYKQKFVGHTPVTLARNFHGRAGLDPGMSFADFVRWLTTDAARDEIADRHWLSQYRVLGLDQGIRYDFVGKLEDFRAGVDEVARRLDVDPAVFQHRLRSAAPDEYLRHYTEELVELIGRRYARDVTEFGYSPPVLRHRGGARSVIETP